MHELIRFVASALTPAVENPSLHPRMAGSDTRRSCTARRTRAFSITQMREMHMVSNKLMLMLVSVVIALPLQVQAGDPIEPNAGTWRTWVISSGRDYRVPPPPGPAATQAELRALADLISHNGAQAQQQIAFWDAGSPAYRWFGLLTARKREGL